MPSQPDLDVVGQQLRTVATDVILPRFRALRDDEVSEKGPGDLVTVADIEAEDALSRLLTAHVPGSVVIGEEAVAADPSMVTAAREHDRVWVIDPIDGTANFVAGAPDFGVMVAFVEQGVTTASWIHHPVSGRLFTAQRGAGATVDGRPLTRSPGSENLADLRATVVTRLLDDRTAARVAARATSFGTVVPHRMPASLQYPRVAEGELDIVLYWRTLVWDHAAGALLLDEVGARAARLDGSDYEPWSDRTGLILAADPATHARAVAVLAPAGRL